MKRSTTLEKSSTIKFRVAHKPPEEEWILAPSAVSKGGLLVEETASERIAGASGEMIGADAMQGLRG